jgi:hypothetical protein
MNRAIVGLAAAAMVAAGLGLGGGVAQADDGGWGPPHHWCPGEEPVPTTGNPRIDPLEWDWNVCHTYYHVWPGMGNVSNLIWDGENPPPRPGAPVAVYCDPVGFLQNCRIDNHP